MKLYVIRHGTTVWNEKGIIQGWSQNQLSKNGKLLIENISLKLKDIPFEVIYASPLKRTMQSANILNKFHNVKIIKDKRIIENNPGIFARRYKKSLTEEDLIMMKNHELCKSERYEDVLKRAEDFVDYLRTTDYDTVLIVTHGLLVKAFYKVILNKETEKAENGEIAIFEI